MSRLTLADIGLADDVTHARRDTDTDTDWVDVNRQRANGSARDYLMVLVTRGHEDVVRAAIRRPYLGTTPPLGLALLGLDDPSAPIERLPRHIGPTGPDRRTS